MDETPMKTCKKCGASKPATAEYFHKHNATRDRLDQRCKTCQSKTKKKVYQDNKDEINERTTAYAKANPEIVRAINKRAKKKKGYQPPSAERAARSVFIKRMRTYGLTPVEYFLMIENQRNCCKSCGDPFKSSKDRHIDHSHVTGKVRGLLCHACNVTLGLMKDDPVKLKNLIAYLEGADLA